MVRQRSAKPLFIGSIPIAASFHFTIYRHSQKPPNPTVADIVATQNHPYLLLQFAVACDHYDSRLEAGCARLWS